MAKCRVPSAVLGAFLAALAGLGAGTAHASEAWQPVQGEQMAFEIFDGDEPAGHLVIRFSRPSPDTLLIDRHEVMTVSRMMLKAKLEQTSEERRVANRLAGFTSRTQLTSAIKNAQASLELGRDADGTLAGKSNEGTVGLPADAMPASLWRGDELRDGVYFDAGSGKPVTLSVKTAAPGEKAPKAYRGPACSGRDVAITTKDKKSRALIWVDTTGHICTMRLFTDLGPLEYVPAARAD